MSTEETVFVVAINWNPGSIRLAPEVGDRMAEARL
jgi:hypothetical protein